MDARAYWSQLILWAAMGVCVGVSVVARASVFGVLPWIFVELMIAFGACAYVAFSDAGRDLPVSNRSLQRVLYPAAVLALLIIAASFAGPARV